MFTLAIVSFASVLHLSACLTHVIAPLPLQPCSLLHNISDFLSRGQKISLSVFVSGFCDLFICVDWCCGFCYSTLVEAPHCLLEAYKLHYLPTESHRIRGLFSRPGMLYKMYCISYLFMRWEGNILRSFDINRCSCIRQMFFLDAFLMLDVF